MNHGAAHPENAARRRHWARQIGRWMAEWETERALRDADEAPAAPPPAGPPVLRYDVAVRAGEIWMLHPEAARPCERPVYMAVLFVRRGGWIGVAPYSRFATPAWEGEWRTGRTTPALRVLGLGFQRLAPARVLAGGWRAGRLTAAERAAVRAWLETDGEPWTRPELSVRGGPPLTHPEDPRWDYVREEEAWLDAWLAAHAAEADAAARIVRETSLPLPLAADERKEPDAYRVRPRPGGAGDEGQA
jgi:hypothetical protein